MGVLLVNLVTAFRVPVLASIFRFHTHDGALNHAVDWVIGVGLEQKAYAIFGMLFGVGIAAQSGASGSGRPYGFFLRRFGVLLGIGVLHFLLLFSGDILMLYALVGLVLIPVRNLSPRPLLVLSAVAFITHACWPSLPVPATGVDRDQAIQQALETYVHGSFPVVVGYRLTELRESIFPLLANSALRTISLALFGMAAWRGGWIRYPARVRKELGLAVAPLLCVGGASTAYEAYAAVHGLDLGRAGTLVSSVALIPLALAYTSALLFAATTPRGSALLRPLALFGRMTLSCYLAQSIVFGLVFYGYGLGQFGAWGSAKALAFGIGFGAIQIAVCVVWLRHHARGPIEALWRRLSYAAAVD